MVSEPNRKITHATDRKPLCAWVLAVARPITPSSKTLLNIRCTVAYKTTSSISQNIASLYLLSEYKVRARLGQYRYKIANITRPQLFTQYLGLEEDSGGGIQAPS